MMSRVVYTLGFALLLVSLSCVSRTSAKAFVPAIPRSGLYPFYNTTSPNPADWSGFEIDILEWMCNESGNVLGDGVDNAPLVNCVPREEWFVGQFAEVFQAIDNGTADFAIGLISRSDEREERYTFVKPFYYSDYASLYVLGSSNLTFESLRGKPVCAVQDYYLNKNNALRDVYGASRVVSLATSREAVQKLQDGECVAMVGGSVGRYYGNSLGLSLVGNRVSEEPIGIITSKSAPQELIDDLSVGLVSTMWEGDRSKILLYENTTLISNGYPANENLLDLVSATTGMGTKNGFELTWEPTTPVFSGGEGVGASGVVNVTLLMFQGSPMPLASLNGSSSFLEDGSTWTGMEVEIGKAICDSPYFNCLDVIVTDNVGDRLSYLDQGLADISIGDISVSQERLNNYSFVQPMYYSAGPAIYVQQSVDVQDPQPSLQEYANGKTLCTLNGGAYNDEIVVPDTTLVYYNTSSEAISGLDNGECDGFLYDSNVSFEDAGLRQAAANMSAAYPIGIAVAPNVPYSVYSGLSALTVRLLDNYPDSALIQWSKEYATGAYPNPQLYTTSEAISDFVLEKNKEVGINGTAVQDAISDAPNASNVPNTPNAPPSAPDAPKVSAQPSIHTKWWVLALVVLTFRM
jgi:ABC-type amino acid transport substrate-binding protein